MRILTEDQYQRRIEEAERRGYEKARKEDFDRQELADFRNSVFHDSQEIRRRLDRLERKVKPAESKQCEANLPPYPEPVESLTF